MFRPQNIAEETGSGTTAARSGRKGNFGAPSSSDASDLELSTLDPSDEPPRLPRAVQAVYLRPLRRHAEYGVPTCDLQLRSYNVRNLEFFSDFCLRAAYYLGLPASGPVPLPRIVERWTVPRSSFIYKKSQENFERRTVRRLIQIKDGNPETVEIWLAFIRKHAYYGIGMKANVYEFEGLGMFLFLHVNERWANWWLQVLLRLWIWKWSR
jgi:small subunit ribosomal protein S10